MHFLDLAVWSANLTLRRQPACSTFAKNYGMDIVSKYNQDAANWDVKLRKRGYSNAYTQFLKKHVGSSQPTLDVGAGTGLFADAWLSAGGCRDLTLLDPSAAMLSLARKRFADPSIKLKSVQARLEDYGSGDRFGTVLAAHVLEHCYDPQGALAKLATHLGQGGQMILVVSKPHWCNWLIWLRYRHRWFSSAEVESWAKSAGLLHKTTHQFANGAPSRTSFGYVFIKK